MPQNYHLHLAPRLAGLILLTACLATGWPLAAQTPAPALQGRVHNGTTNQPAAGVTVEYVMLQQGMVPAGTAVTDAQGVFRFNSLPAGSGSGPALLQATYQGATYSQPLIPGQTPAGGPEIVVYEASKDKSLAALTEHVIFLSPQGDELEVMEQIDVQNNSTPPRAYVNPKGTYLFTLPDKPRGDIQATIEGAAGMPIPLTLEPQKQPNSYAVTYPLRPGQSLIRLEYTLNYRAPLEFTKPLVEPAEHTFLVTPGDGVQLTGENLISGGKEPTTGLATYQITPVKGALHLVVSGQAPPQQADATEDAQNPPAAVPIPDPATHKRWLLLSVLGAVMLGGFVYLYRTSD